MTEAGHPFNINSPQQLGKVLFEEMNLPAPVKYGKGKVDLNGGGCAGGARAELSGGATRA